MKLGGSERRLEEVDRGSYLVGNSRTEQKEFIVKYSILLENIFCVINGYAVIQGLFQSGNFNSAPLLSQHGYF